MSTKYKQYFALTLALLLAVCVFVVDIYVFQDVILPAALYFASILIAAYFVSPRATIVVAGFAAVLNLIADVIGHAPPYLLIIYSAALVFVGLVCAALARRIEREAASAAEKEQLRADAEQRSAELEFERARWQATVDNMLDLVTVCDANGSVTYINPAYTRAIGRFVEPGLPLEEHPKFYQIYHPDGTMFAAEDLPLQKAALENVAVKDVEIVHRASDGREFIGVFSASPIHNENGAVVGAVAVGRDVTEQRQAEEKIRRQNAILDGINRIFLEALTRETEEELGLTCLAVAEEITQSKFGFIGEINAEGKLDAIAISDPGWDLCRMEPKTGHRQVPTGFVVHGIYGRVLLDGKGFYTNDPASHPDSVGIPERHPPLTAFLGVPLIQGSKTIGMVAVGNRKDGYRDEDLAALESLAPAIAQALLTKRAEKERERLMAEIQRRAAEAFEERDKLRTLIDSIADEVWFADAEGNIILINTAVAKGLGLERVEDFYGPMSEVVPRFEVYNIDGTPRTLEENPMLRILQGETIRDGEEIVVNLKTGEKRYRQFTGAPIRNESGEIIGGVTVVRDVTERKRAEEAIRSSQRLLEQVLDALPVGVWIHDASGQLLMVNPEGQRIFVGAKYVGVEEFGEYKGWWLNTGKRVGAHDWAGARAIEHGETSLNDEIEIEAFDGTRKIISNSAVPILDETGRITGAVVVNMDITERKEAEAERERLLAEVQRRVGELDAVNKELEAFTYSVSHDLRAPLRHIDGFSEALLEDYSDKLDEQGKEYLQFVRAGAQRMDLLINDLLQLSRATQAEMHRESVNLSEIAESIAIELKQEEPKRQVDFIIAPNVRANGDPRLLHIVMENLLGNAWKFTSKRDKARIEFGETVINGKATYYVRDNGVGFDMAYADKLFVPFQRLHGAEEFPGTGIGLATVQRVIRRHGGRIWAEGEVDNGATFYFTLP